MIERLTHVTHAELDALTRLWEASVRATHHFLQPTDIDLFREMVRNEALSAVELYVVRNSEGAFTAFIGLSEDKIEMLFVAPQDRGKGLGRQLIHYAIARRSIRLVDVNEQNEQAVRFYLKQGFRTVSRDALDPSGRPYPILHLEL